MAMMQFNAPAENENIRTGTTVVADEPSWLNDPTINGKTYLLSLAIVVIGFLLAILLLRTRTKGDKGTDSVEKTVEAPATPTPAAACDDAQLVAVITAAIMAARQEEKLPGGFRVVSLKRAENRQ